MKEGFFKIYIGDKVMELIPYIAKMRLHYFRQFPYLYEGSLDTEMSYLEEFSKNQESIVVTFENSGRVGGFFSGLPLESNSPIVQIIPSYIGENRRTFYLSDLIIENEFRNKGLASNFFSKIEEQVKIMGFSRTCFLTVYRNENHKLKPQHYKETSTLWLKYGYHMRPEVVKYRWRSITESHEVLDMDHKMNVWCKEIL